MATSKYQFVVKEAQQLSPQEQLELIRQLAESLANVQPKLQQPRYLVYGEFRDTPGREFSTEEDFKLAEWHPTEAELNSD